MHPGYYTTTHTNQIVWRCSSCPYDTFTHSNIVHHVSTHPPIYLPESDIDLSTWVLHTKAKGELKDLIIGIGFLTWNTDLASEYAAGAIASEVTRLKVLGINVKVFWADNGSSDDTVAKVKAQFKHIKYLGPSFGTNVGQSRARNSLINLAVAHRVDMYAMVDGDIEIIPFSIHALALCLKDAPSNIGCIGMLASNCTHEHDDYVSRTCRVIDLSMLHDTPQIAWTNYGIFRMEMFNNGLRFDESGAFKGPGWGFEDNDMYLAMLSIGYKSFNTKLFRHMHRRRHSSINILGPNLAAKLFESRKRYLLDKWKRYDFARPHLDVIENQHMPVLEY